VRIVAAMREQFLAGADVVLAAVADPRVGVAWERPSVLADQTIGSLAGHLARGGVWVVGDYLDVPIADGPVTFGTAAEYFAGVTDLLTEADHTAIRQRGAKVASMGHAAVVARLRTAVADLTGRLADQPPDRTIAVYGGSSMALDDYLRTRIVEQVVHLDDLSRSLDIEPWPNPPDAEAIVLACGAEIGRLRRGGPAMIRALFRDGAVGVLPVL
jgi:hypothetical protein